MFLQSTIHTVWFFLLGFFLITLPTIASPVPAEGSSFVAIEAGRIFQDADGREARLFLMEVSAPSVGILEVTTSDFAQAPRIVPESCSPASALGSVYSAPYLPTRSPRVSVTLEHTPGRWMFGVLQPSVCAFRIVAHEPGRPLGRYELHSRMATSAGVLFGEWLDAAGSEDDEIIEVEPDLVVFPPEALAGQSRVIELSGAGDSGGLYSLRVTGVPH